MWNFRDSFLPFSAQDDKYFMNIVYVISKSEHLTPLTRIPEYMNKPEICPNSSKLYVITYKARAKNT